ncbi:protein of unknown function [Clostridium beijerinckii]|nr:protein of unknown function [Clostridium beijerinckii]
MSYSMYLKFKELGVLKLLRKRDLLTMLIFLLNLKLGKRKWAIQMLSVLKF